MGQIPILDDRMIQHSDDYLRKQILSEGKCEWCKLGISCLLWLHGDLIRHPLSQHDKEESLEDHSVYPVADVNPTQNAVHDEPYLQACNGGVQRQAHELEDEATEPAYLLLRFISACAEYQSQCYKGRYTLFLLIFVWVLPVANSKIIETPQNMAIGKRESHNGINLACKSDCQCRLRWSLKKNQDSESELLYNGYALRSDAMYYCSVITDEPGKFYLDLTNTAEAAQTYVCLEPGSLDQVSAEVIWLSELNCTDRSTEDFVNLTCNIEFRGNWAPTMEWKEQSSQGEKVLSVGVKTDTIPNQRVTSTLVMEVQEGIRYYTCTSKFSLNGKPNITTAGNVPIYSDVWISSAFTESQDKMTRRSVVIPASVIVAAISSVFLVSLAAVGIVLVKKNREKTKKKRVEQVKETQPLA